MKDIKNMKIKEIETYLDGGSQEVITDEGTFWVDGRLFTKTEGRVYNTDPDAKNSFIVDKELEEKILKLVEEYNK